MRASCVEAQKVLQQVLDRGYRGIAEETAITGSVEEVAEGFGLSKSSAAPRSSCVISHGQPKLPGSLERLAAVRAALA